jgi:hypothetical protein
MELKMAAIAASKYLSLAVCTLHLTMGISLAERRD